MTRICVALVVGLSGVLAFAAGGWDEGMESREWTVGGFSAIEVGGGIEVEVEHGAAVAVSVRAQPRVLRRVRVTVEGSVLVIGLEPGSSFSTRGIHATVRVPRLEGLTVTGGARAVLGPDVTAGAFRATVSGGGGLRGQVRADLVDLDTSGGGGIELEGSCERVSLKSSGGSWMRLAALEAAVMAVDLSGGAQADVSATERLSVRVDGGSRLTYRGDPRVDVVDVSGGGSIARI